MYISGELADSSHLLGDDNALQARLAKDGYVFFRGLLPADALLELRDQVTAILAHRGWIRGGEQRLMARVKSLPHREGEPEFLETLGHVMKLEALHSLAHHPALLQAMKQCLGPSAFPHPLSIMRMIFPQAPELSTPPHQDYPNNQGSRQLTAAWIPLGDCAMSQGSVAVLEGSSQFGLLPLDFHLGPGNRAAVLDERLEQCRWLASDMAVGDVLCFSALTVHRALHNTSADRMRLSVDFRYQLEGEALTPICLKPHFDCLDWEEIYRDWHSDDLKYYWRDKQYDVVPWEEDMHALPAHHFDAALAEEIRFGNRVRERYQDLLSDQDDTQTKD